MAHSGRFPRAAVRAIAAGCALLATGAPTGVRAQAAATLAPTPAPQAGAGSPGRSTVVRVPLEVALKLNGKFLGTISIAVDNKGAGEIDARRLAELIGPVVDPKIMAALDARIAGRTKVDFDELAVEGFGIRFDSLALEVVGTLAPDASRPTSLVMAPRQDIPVPARFDQPADFSAGVNVLASQRYVHGSRGGFAPVRADFNVIANVGGFDGVTFTGGSSYTGERWDRREFRATHDDFQRAVRTTLGEFTPSSTSFQGSGRLLGVGLERSYSAIRPFQNTRPIGRQDFTLERASTVDVFVNDIRVQTLRLDSGRYDISDFPFAAGPNRVRLVVEDVGGRRDIVDLDVFNSTELLTPGITEFGGALGLRESGRFHYGWSPAATGYTYRGLSDVLTLGLNGQATRRGAQVGGSAVFGARLGFVQVEAAASRSFAGGGTGVAASLDYRGDFSLRAKSDLRINASAIYRSARFKDAFAFDLRNQEAVQAVALVQWQAPFGVGLGLGGGWLKARRPGFDVYRLDGTLGRTFGRFGISGTASRAFSRDDRLAETRFAVGLTMRLGSRNFASARYDSGTGRSEVELARSGDGRLGEVTGNIRYTQERDQRVIAGRLAYINNRFDLVLNHNRIETRRPDGRTSAESDWSLQTFIGYAGGSFGIGRGVNSAFVIAPVHKTLRGAQASVVSGDRVIARSGFFGPAVVPIDRAYGVARYEIKVDPLPVGYDIGSGSIEVFPGYGSGYRATVGSDASYIAVGFLATAEGPVALASGSVEPVDAARRKTWKERGIFTNRAGRFVADRLAPGRYRIVLGGGRTAEFEVKPGSEGLVDVGTIRVAP